MKLSKVFLSSVVLNLLAVAASAALPAFSQQTIGLPPLTLLENAKANLHLFERSPSIAPTPDAISERRVLHSDKFVVSPATGVDYKLLIKHPDPSVNYNLIVKEAGWQDGK